MKRVVNFLFLFLAQLSMLLIMGCSDDDNIDTNNGGEASLTINGEPYYSSVVGDFVMGEFMGSNFIDNLTSDGCYYAYGCFTPANNPELDGYNIDIYFEPIDFTKVKNGTQLIKCDEPLNRWFVSTIENGGMPRYYRNHVSGNIYFDAYDSKNKLVKLEFKKVTFSNDSGEQIVVDGMTYFDNNL